MIKITAKRARISSDFADAIRSISVAYIAKIKQEIEYYPRMKSVLLKKYEVPLAQHLKALKDPSVLDLELTALRNLPFEKFEVLQIPAFTNPARSFYYYYCKETAYLSGTTAEIICKRSNGLVSNIGRYRISISLPRLGVGTGENEPHFIPLLDEFTHGRFYHHTASASAVDLKHAEMMHPSTCWGSFDVTATINSFIPSRIFKILHQYLSVSNSHSLR